jgi:hypothetical protein
MAILLSGHVRAEDADEYEGMKPEPTTLQSTEWKLNATDAFRLDIPAADGPSHGQVTHIRTGRAVNTWNTGSVARQFYAPLVLGSYPRQSVIVPYLVGGGTDCAEINWVLIVVTEPSSVFTDMGLGAAWSHAKDQYDFRISPCLVNASGNIRLDFRYTQLEDGATSVITGTLDLNVDGDGGPALTPVNEQDAEAVVRLQDSSLEAVRNWGKMVQSSGLAS